MTVLGSISSRVKIINYEGKRSRTSIDIHSYFINVPGLNPKSFSIAYDMKALVRLRAIRLSYGDCKPLDGFQLKEVQH